MSGTVPQVVEPVDVVYLLLHGEQPVFPAEAFEYPQPQASHCFVVELYPYPALQTQLPLPSETKFPAALHDKVQVYEVGVAKPDGIVPQSVAVVEVVYLFGQLVLVLSFAAEVCPQPTALHSVVEYKSPPLYAPPFL